MNVFELDVEPKDAAGALGIDEVNLAVFRALSERLKSEKITKAEIARRLSANKSTITRLLKGNQNLTARTLGELLWALDFEFEVVLRDLLDGAENSRSAHSNYSRSNCFENRLVYSEKPEKRNAASASNPGYVLHFADGS